jgi:hypothetical protein
MAGGRAAIAGGTTGSADGDARAEIDRLEEERSRRARWKHWGPYVADRAWGTVREDYSASGDAWGHLPHDHARSRAYRWNEDGLAGICDKHQTLCLALALWNGRDPILKERLFGLTGPEGNHGEDVKEIYFHEDATPTASYLRMRYLYPQRAFPYGELVEGNRRRSIAERELELWEVGAFEGDRWFDVVVEYAKAAPDDIVMVVTATNHGPDPAPLHVLPTAWFRNTWDWARPDEPRPERPRLAREADRPEGAADEQVKVLHHELGEMWLHLEGRPDLLFTENETNAERLFGAPSTSPHVKDAFHRRVVGGEEGAVNAGLVGSKCAGWYRFDVPPGETVKVRARLTARPTPRAFDDADELVALRRREADAFYDHVQGPHLGAERRAIHRKAMAGLFWTMQFYHYDVARWLDGDAIEPPRQRRRGRNRQWRHLAVADVISMPDGWEYPWFAAWDLAFHMVAVTAVDVDLAKQQLKLMVKEWYQHPSGQTPAYEWELSDLNPPVLAWAAYQIFKIERRQRGRGDRVFLERVFHKLLINFAWWVNREDEEGNNLFAGGFLGLDNISILDRSEQLPPGVRLEQADATAWMAMYCLDLMRIALELAGENSAYEDLASKFFEHFLYIAYALHHPMGELHGASHLAPWCDDGGAYYDVLRTPRGEQHVRVRSLVGLVPLFAVHVITARAYGELANFRRRKQWFLSRNPHLAEAVTERPDGGWVLSAVPLRNLPRVLGDVFDEGRFLSPFGPRSLSKEHEREPVRVRLGDGRILEVGYEPGESTTRMKGGNSNWRGPVWMPAGYMVYRALLRMEHGFGDAVRIPPRDGRPAMSLKEGAMMLGDRMIALFERAGDGRRPALGPHRLFQEDPRLADSLLFHEYFHGDSGEGLGASHQTGWTALVGDLVLRQDRLRQGTENGG